MCAVQMKAPTLGYIRREREDDAAMIMIDHDDADLQHNYLARAPREERRG